MRQALMDTASMQASAEPATMRSTSPRWILAEGFADGMQACGAGGPRRRCVWPVGRDLGSTSCMLSEGF
jgi:hypothetical protein